MIGHGKVTHILSICTKSESTINWKVPLALSIKDFKQTLKPCAAAS